MNKSLIACCVLGLALAAAQADTVTSSASSLASKSVGSVSDSFQTSSESSSGETKAAAGPYTVTRVAQLADGRQELQLAPQTAAQAPLTLRLPAALVAEQGLQAGAALHVLTRPYGLAVAHQAEGEPFFVALNEPLRRDLESKKV
jgi:hypothetical protein